MNTIDHGQWDIYVPASLPEGAPANALFARRQGDGVDWYDYVNDSSSFNPAYVKIAAFYRTATSEYIVGPAVYDATEIFPGRVCIIHEVTDYAGSDPQADLGNKAFDPATGTFTDPIMPPSALAVALQDMDKRFAALEARQKE